MDSSETGNLDSVFSVVSRLCEHVVEQKVSNPTDRKVMQKQHLRLAYECLLKKCRKVEDDSGETDVDIVLCEMLFTIQSHFKEKWNDVKYSVIRLFSILEAAAQNGSCDKETIASLLKMILLIYDHSSKKKSSVQSWSKHRFIRSRSEFREDWLRRLKTNQSNYFFPGVFSEVKNDPRIKQLFSFSHKVIKRPEMNGMKKSFTWDEKMSEFGKENYPQPVVSIYTSQILDEGYVTPNDDHREVSPDPAKTADARRNTDFFDFFTCDVVKQQPKYYYSWDAVGMSCKDRWNSRDLRSRIALKSWQLSGNSSNVLTMDSFIQDISDLLVGLPSSNFILVNNKFVMVNEVIIVDSEPVFARDCQDLIECGTYFYLLHNFVLECKSPDDFVLWTICHVVKCFLYRYETIVSKPKKGFNSKLNVVLQCPIRPLKHLRFLWEKISMFENNFSCQQFLDHLYDGMFKITDQDLLCLIILILNKCTDVYVSRFLALIKTGQASSDLGPSTWELSTVPKFLDDIKKITSDSFRSLYLLHKYGRHLLVKSLFPKAPAVKDNLKGEANKALKEHLEKFLQKQKEKHAAVAKIKQEKLQEILDDIASKREWKELERIKLEEKDRKIDNYYEKLDKLRETLLEEAKAEVIRKFEALSQEAEKNFSLTQWKTKRLNLSKGREALLMKELDEDTQFRNECKEKGINLKEANSHLLVKPITVKIPSFNVNKAELNVEDTEFCYSRSIDAFENKLKSTKSSDAWKFDPSSKCFDRDNFLIDEVAAINEYKANKQRAVAIKQSVMSSDLTEILCNQADEKQIVPYKGLSEEERKELEKSLVDITILKKGKSFIDTDQIISDLKNLKYVEGHGGTQYQINFDDRPSYADFLNRLSSSRIMLCAEIKAANENVLSLLKDNFLAVVGLLREYFLFGNSSWSRRLSQDLVELMRSRCGLWYISLNHLLPSGFSTVAKTDSTWSLDPTEPSCLNSLTLAYQAPRPIDYLLIEKIMEKYQEFFNFLKQLECGFWMLSIVHSQLRVRDFRKHNKFGVHLKKCEFYHHVMNHLMSSLRSFIYSSIEAAWSSFTINANKAKSIDELFKIHCTFIDNVSLICCHKKKVHKLLQCLNKVIRSIYLFCELMNRSRWSLGDEGKLMNSKFSELEHTFETFLSQVKILCNYLQKILDAGFDGSLANLKYILCMNSYYELNKDDGNTTISSVSSSIV